VVEIFVVSEMRVVVWEAILKREDWPLHGNRLYKTKCDQVASTPPKNGTQVEVYLYMYVQNIYTTPFYLNILFRLSSLYPQSHSLENKFPY
jgi:hypothetical protein